jgi:flagellar FliJ protein
MPAAKFNFTLEPLLRARRLQEQERQRAVAEIERQRIAIEDELRRQQDRIASAKGSMREQLVGAIDAWSLRMHAASSMAVMRQAQRAVLELAGVHRRLESARVELVEAMRSRRAVELLRERRYEAWKMEVDRAEASALDELAIIDAARRKLGNLAGERTNQ